MSQDERNRQDKLLPRARWRNGLLVRPVREYPLSDHYNGRRFHNLERGARNTGDIWRWLYTRQPSRWPSWEINPEFPLPPNRLSDNIQDWRATFINHATVLVQIGPYNILTDPVWSERVSPFRQAGPRRVRAAGIALKDLPAIDVILLSHNHYDHLDLATLKFIETRDNPLIVTGLGNAPLMRANGIQKVVELDWWQSVEHKELRIHFTPAKHFSGRGLRDTNQTLWGGLWVECSAGGLFFAGDTGYGKHFKQIQARLGSPRLALLPIGAYEPRWFMRSVHMNPDDAVCAHQDLQAQQSLGIHFNTFQLTDEAIDQPVIDLEKALQARGVPPAQFQVLKEGEGRAY